MFDIFNEPNYEPDYHATYSIQLIELINAGFNPFGHAAWNHIDWFSDEQRERWQEKFLLRYNYREIGLTPAGYWRAKLTSLVFEQMPKYKPLYKALADGADIMAIGDEYGKEREVYSAFPATQLNTETQDYAKSANDRQHETVQTGNFIEQASKLASSYNDVDVMLLNDCEEVFSCLMSATLPAM